MTRESIAVLPHERTCTVQDLVSLLPEILGKMWVDSRCTVMIAEFSDARYVQFWAEPGVGVIGEVISNHNIGPYVALDKEGEEILLTLGWREPLLPHSPNWSFVADSIAKLVELVELTLSAVLDALGQSTSHIVTLKSFEVLASANESSVGSNREQCRRLFQKKLREIEDAFYTSD